MSVRDDVMITGIGLITALGLDIESNWRNLVEGKPGVERIKRFDPSDLETQIAAELPEDFESHAQKLISKRERDQMTRTTRLAVAAAAEAVADSRIDFKDYDPSRIAVILGVVRTSYNEMERNSSGSHIIVKSMPNAPSAWISIRYGLKGPNFSVATACASSSYAICLACDMIRSGVADVVITGGADSHVEPEMIKGFNQILTLSVNNESPATSSRPFSKNRDGFVMGEGAGMLVLESKQSASKRNADVYAGIAGYALTSEASNIVALKQGGIGMADTMRRAIENSGFDKNAIAYINAHGTSTYYNDKFETAAIKRVFGEKATKIPVSSTKSMIGHTIGASGAIEAIVTALSIQHGMLTPTINYDVPDPELDLDYIPNQSREANVPVALSNAFGFGGHNSSIVLRRYVQ